MRSVDLAAAHGDEAVLQHVQFAGHQGEQVAGLGEGIAPDREVAPARQLAGLDQVAVGQQARIGALSASIRTVKRASTSGRSGNQVILRKPSASHWVQKRPADMYSPSSALLPSGSISTSVSRMKASATTARSGCSSVDLLLARPSARPSMATRDRLQAHAVQSQRLGVLAVAPHGEPRLHPRRAGLEVEVEVDLSTRKAGGR